MIAVSDAAMRWVRTVCVLVLATGFFILLLPSPRRYPLVAADAWEVQSGFFQDARPDNAQVNPDLLASQAAVFWRSWNPQTGSVLGRMASKPFPLPEYMVVPYIGYAGHPAIRLFVECVATGKRMHIASANAHEQWVEATLRIPPSWCASTGRLVAESHTKEKYVGLGTPFTASFIDWLKESIFTVAFIHALMFAFLVAISVAAGVCLTKRVTGAEYMPLLGIAAVGLLGYIAFFLYDTGPLAGCMFSVCVVAAGFLAFASRRFRAAARELWSNADVRLPVICFYLVSLFYVLLLYAVDNGAGSFTATYRYDPASWSTDNQIAQTIAEKMATAPRRQYLSIFGTGGWKVSDRPPLLTGVFLLVRPILNPLFGFGDIRHRAYYFYQIGGIILMTCWILPVWLFCRKCGLSASRALLSVAVVASSSFALFNSSYIWPKMASGAFALGAYVLLVQDPLILRKRPALPRVVVAAVLAALASVFHGGVVFGLIALGTLLCMKPFFLGWRRTAMGAVVFLVMLLPWTIWQRTVNPPGNALIKYALAGTFGFGEDSLGVADTVRRAYSKMTFQQWRTRKWNAVKNLLGVDTAGLDNPNDEILARWRRRDFYFVVPSLGVLNAGWVFAGIGLWSSRRRKGCSAPTWPHLLIALLLGVFSFLLNAVLTWDLHIVHHNSYLAMLAMVVPLAVFLVCRDDFWGKALVAAHFGYCLLVWVGAPLVTANRVNFGILTGCVLTCAAAWCWAKTELHIAPAPDSASDRTASHTAA